MKTFHSIQQKPKVSAGNLNRTALELQIRRTENTDYKRRKAIL